MSDEEGNNRNNKRQKQEDDGESAFANPPTSQTILDLASEMSRKYGKTVGEERLRKEIQTRCENAGTLDLLQLKDIAKDAALDLMQEKMLEQKKALKNVKPTMISKLLQSHHCTDQNERQLFQIRRAPGATSSSHIATTHDGAGHSPGVFEVDELTYLTSEDGDEFGNRASSLLVLMSNCGRRWMTYINEAEVQSYIGRVLEDAVAYVNWALSKTNNTFSRLEKRSEASIFSNKPDHLVVCDSQGSLLPVMFTEAKNPHNSVFESTTVNGQIFDYMMTGRLMTGRPNFGVVSTFNQSKVVWTDHHGCDDVASTAERLKQCNLLQTCKEFIATKGRVPSNALSIAQPPVLERMTTPATLVAEQPSTESPPEMVDERHTMGGDDLNRNVKQSETYEGHQLFTLFCNAIVASMSFGCSKMQIVKSYNKLKVQDAYLCLRNLSVYPKRKKPCGHAWGIVKEEKRVDPIWKFDSSQKELWVVEYLGVGSTSRVWRAVAIQTEGKSAAACVVKYWIKVWDLAKNDCIPKTVVDKESDIYSTAEVENYHRIYNEFSDLKDCVGRLKLNGRWCVIMPFFEPLSKEERTEEMLREVKKLLSEAFYKDQDGLSFQFQESDQRWRHVAKWRGKVVLIDLAHLERKEVGRDAHKDYVEKHIERLKERMQML